MQSHQQGEPLSKGLALVIVIGLCSLACSSEEPPAEQDEVCQAMFVQHAQGMSFNGSELSLDGADPNIIYFCDRPVSEAGHVTWDGLMELGGSSKDRFEVDAPNAAVSVLGSDGEVIKAVVTLTAKPSLTDGRVVFPVALLEGDRPGVGGVTLLFIDRIGRPPITYLH